MNSALAIFAKSPMRGKVKTRLCPPLTPDQATALYRAFLLDTMHIISEIDGVQPGVLFTPSEALEDFRALAPANFFLVPQVGEGFGERLAHGFRELFALGYEAVAIMDADSPTLPRKHIMTLFEQLQDPRCEIAIGPSDDGGYWAIGMKQLYLEVLSDISWSSELVLGQTLERARDANLFAACASTWYDIDNGETLNRLRGELSDSPVLMPMNTRQVLEIIENSPYAARIILPRIDTNFHEMDKEICVNSC